MFLSGYKIINYCIWCIVTCVIVIPVRLHLVMEQHLCLSPTVQVPGVHGVWTAGCVDQYGLDLCHPHPVSLHPALQHLPSENPLALLCHWALYPRYI